MPNSSRHHALLIQALNSPIGLLLRVSDFNRARAALYAARAEANDPRLAVLQFRASPFPEGDLVICKLTAAANAAKAMDEIDALLGEE